MFLSDEILYAVVDMYTGEDGCLPSSDEVLLCSNNVSQEQVSLFVQDKVVGWLLKAAEFIASFIFETATANTYSFVLFCFYYHEKGAHNTTNLGS